MQYSSVCISIILFSFLLPSPGAGQFHVIGPRSPVIALVGGEAVLPCHLNPPTDAQSMEIRWYHHQSSLVGEYRNSQDNMKHQKLEYQGRTKLLRENITKGQVALRIHSIHPSDEGDYSCFFLSSTYYNEAQFKVLVTGSGLAPQIHIEPDATRGLTLTCTSLGWYPEPEVWWDGMPGLHFTPAAETQLTKENGMFHVRTSIKVDKSLRRNVSCFIRNKVLHEEKEAHVSLAGALFPRDKSWKMGLAVFVVLLQVSLLVTCALLMHTKRAKSSLKEKHELLIKQKEKIQEENDKLEEECGKITEELEKRKFLAKMDLKKAQQFAEDIVLDAATAHPYLLVTGQGKCVTYVTQKQDVPDNPERFDTLVAVLGQNSFSAGDHYWEVGVAGKSMWAVGLCLDSIRRKGQYTNACPENGFWILRLQKGECTAFSTPRHLVTREPLSRLGVFLQYEKGLISFYNVTEFIILYTFESKFTSPLRPYFYPGTLSVEKTNGLTILKV